VSLLVDTSVWSLASRRDTEAAVAEVKTLQHALEGADPVDVRQPGPGGPPLATCSLERQAARIA
jgi:hypothetical protein